MPEPRTETGNETRRRTETRNRFPALFLFLGLTALVALPLTLLPLTPLPLIAQSPLPEPNAANPQGTEPEEIDPEEVVPVSPLEPVDPGDTPSVAPAATELPIGLPEPLERSPGNASYDIAVTLDAEAKTLDGRQVLTWTNIREVPTAELTFHLYWNAWRNSESTWLRERAWSGRGAPRGASRDGWSWQRPKSVRLLAHSGSADPGVVGSDLTSRAHWDAPDDGNPDDRTVLVVPLPAPVAPGETVQVEMEWEAKIPRTFARTGYRGNYFFIAHWFPKLGVFEGPAGWANPQFHSNTEFYSDYGRYDVAITVPSSFVVGATGELQGEPGGEGEAKTLRFVQEDVHGFAWTASPDFRVAERRFEHDGLPPVDVRLLYQPEHESQVDRHFAATFATLERYGTWYGPYPYGHVTVVDPAWGSGTGGMEYPTLFTCGTRLFNPPGGGSPEGVTIHEAGHQFWYGLVGNDEFEHAWIDEGLNTFSTARTFEEAYGEDQLVVRYLDPPGTRFRGGFFARRVPEITFPRTVFGNRLNRYRRDARADVPATPTWQYFPGSASNITYAKTALWLHTLERHLGWETLQEILSTFFDRYRFRHPEPEDFFSIANQIAEERTGESLDWFFDQVYRDNAAFDYAVTEVRSRPVRMQGWVEAEGEEGIDAELVSQGGRGGGRGEEEGSEQERGEGDEESSRMFRTEVLVQRLQDGVFPVDVLLVFEDDTEIRRHWNGQSPWKLFTHEGPAKLRHAVVDPDRVLLLDLSVVNNSRRLEPASSFGATKWASKWMIWLQDLLQTYTFFV